jgi:hypothetical protein
MRFVKLILISALVFAGVLTALSFIFPSHLRVSRSINVAASREKVYAALSDLRSWDEWNEFIRSSSLTGKTWSSPSSGKGAFMRSDQLLLTMTGTGPDSVHLFWRQEKGRSFDGGFYIFRMQTDSLTIQGWMDFQFRWYPWEKLGILLYDKRLGPVLEESLAGLKRYVENSH